MQDDIFFLENPANNKPNWCVVGRRGSCLKETSIEFVERIGVSAVNVAEAAAAPLLGLETTEFLMGLFDAQNNNTRYKLRKPLQLQQLHLIRRLHGTFVCHESTQHGPSLSCCIQLPTRIHLIKLTLSTSCRTDGETKYKNRAQILPGGLETTK